MSILMIVLFAILVITTIVWGQHQAKQRTEALAALCRRRSWRLLPDHDRDMEGRYLAFTCLQYGSDRYAFNVFEGQSAGRPLCGFDYHYETTSIDSKGNTTTHNHYFSALVVDVGLPLTPLVIRPEGFWDKVGALFGADDIDFELEEFSRQFCVRGPDRRWAYDVLQQSTMEFLLGAPRFNIELHGSNIMCHRPSTFEPAEFEAALAVALGIVDRLPNEFQQQQKGAPS